MGHSKRYSRIPEAVLTDPNISPEAVRIYGYLALWVFQGNVSRRGMRQIGRDLEMGRMTVCRAIEELIKSGHISAGSVDRGRRGWYVLNSPVFASKQRAGVEEVISYPRKRMVTAKSA